MFLLSSPYKEEEEKKKQKIKPKTSTLCGGRKRDPSRWLSKFKRIRVCGPFDPVLWALAPDLQLPAVVSSLAIQRKAPPSDGRPPQGKAADVAGEILQEGRF